MIKHEHTNTSHGVAILVVAAITVILAEPAVSASGYFDPAPAKAYEVYNPYDVNDWRNHTTWHL